MIIIEIFQYSKIRIQYSHVKNITQKYNNGFFCVNISKNKEFNISCYDFYWNIAFFTKKY